MPGCTVRSRLRIQARASCLCAALALAGAPRTLRAETEVGGTIVTAEWTEAAGPYHVTATVVVPAGATLTIEPGVVVGFDPDTCLVVRGSLVAAGTVEKPVKLLPRVAGEKWAGVLFLTAAASGTLEHVELGHVRRVIFDGTEYKAAFDIMGGPKVRIQSSWFHDFDGVVIYSEGGSELEFLDSLLENSHEAINSVRSYARIEGSTIRNLTGYSDCIDYDFESTPQSVIRNCLIENNAEDDGLDLGGSSCLVENVEIRGVKAGKAISIDMVCSPTIRNVVVHDCMWGLVAKDKATPQFDHCTVSRCDIGFYCFNKVPGAGGGHGTGDSLILWGNVENTKVDALSTLVLTDSLVGGGYAGAGNIDADPLFADPAAGDFHLLPGSPAIGTGTGGTDMGAFPYEGPPPPAVFVRGEASDDGELNIGDAVTVLLYLFSDTVTPTCLDAFDVDDSGTLDVTDAIYLLGYLFLGSQQPPAPFPDPGPDPTPDDPYECAPGA